MFSTLPGQGMDSLQCTLPKGIWLSFDFDDSHPVCMTVHIDMLWFSIFSAHINTFHSFLFFFFFLTHFWLLQDLPALYLQGGTIIPVGPPHQHVGESNIFDDLTLVVALDEHGNYDSVNFFNK